jgi:hypothetical protein
MNTLQTNNLNKYHFSYVSEYSEIYEPSYDMGFIFVDPEEEDLPDQSSDLDSLITPPFYN